MDNVAILNNDEEVEFACRRQNELNTETSSVQTMTYYSEKIGMVCELSVSVKGERSSKSLYYRMESKEDVKEIIGFLEEALEVWDEKKKVLEEELENHLEEKED